MRIANVTQSLFVPILFLVLVSLNSLLSVVLVCWERISVLFSMEFDNRLGLEVRRNRPLYTQTICFVFRSNLFDSLTRQTQSFGQISV